MSFDHKAWREANRDDLRTKAKAYTAANADKIQAYQKAYRQTNQDKRNAKQRECAYVRRYGIPLEAVEAIFEYQGGCCAICRRPLTLRMGADTERTHGNVDHCHDTGAVRGILCSACNTRESWARQYGDELRAYLERPPAGAILELA